MGAGQSSDRGAASAASDVKTSYYELLGVQRQATEDEIKKAYRRKALELHPDRNYGNEKVATTTFAEVQAAYEVLSDPQERAWYDSHETAILRGDDVGEEDGVPTYENVRITTADNLARMVRKFNSGVDFTDAPSGFFGFLRGTFEQLAKEEDIAASWDNADAPEYPSFGHKDDSYDFVVKNFYASWSSFSTVKNFSWKDKYRLSEAPDRWYRRRMEQENKKFRQDGIREFNDAVRSLVAFVRKRDPRYVPSTQTEAERQQVLRDAAKAQAARARAANAASISAEVPAWAEAREPEELEESEEEEIEVQIFECVACNKEFKSERQWEAHERSKKHQKAVAALQRKMRKDNANYDLDRSDVDSGAVTPTVDGDSEHVSDMENVDEFEPAAVETHSGLDGVEDQVNGFTNEGTGNAVSDETNRDIVTGAHAEVVNGIVDGHENQSSPVEDEQEHEQEHEQSDYASLETVQARLASTSISGVDTPAATAADSDDEDEDQAEAVKPKMGKAAQKRAKKAAAAASHQEAEGSHSCATCQASFPSKTRLFQHIKDHGHAAPKVVAAGGGAGAKKGKGKRK